MTKTSRRILEDNQYRFWVSIAAYLICSLLVVQRSPSHLLYLTLAFVLYCSLFGVAHYEAKQGRAGILFRYSLLTVDSIAVTAAVCLTGFFESPMFVLYLVIFGLCIYHQSLADLVYSAVLSLSLYVSIPILFMEQRPALSTLIGEVILLCVLTAVLYSILMMIIRERRSNARLVSQAKTLSQIGDLLSGVIRNPKECVKAVSALVDQEMKTDGLTCRISIHRPDQRFLPPSGGQMGAHIPISAGDFVFGTMVVSRDTAKPLNATEHEFFTSLGKSLGLYLHRSKIWEEFQDQLEKIQSSLLLDAADVEALSKTNQALSDENLTNMLQLISMERGKWRLQKEVCDFSKVVRSVANEAHPQAVQRGVDLRVEGVKENPPLFWADAVRLKQLMSHLIFSALLKSPRGSSIDVRVDYTGGRVEATLQDRGQGEARPIDLSSKQIFSEESRRSDTTDLGMVICRNIVDAHGGQLSVHWNPDLKIRTVTFTIPMESSPLAAATFSS